LAKIFKSSPLSFSRAILCSLPRALRKN